MENNIITIKGSGRVSGTAAASRRGGKVRWGKGVTGKNKAAIAGKRKTLVNIANKGKGEKLTSGQRKLLSNLGVSRSQVGRLSNKGLSNLAGRAAGSRSKNIVATGKGSRGGKTTPTKGSKKGGRKRK